MNGQKLIEELQTRESPHGTVMAVSMMKDEAPFLLEWFAHHLAVGFTDILVYTNDCSDGTVEMLERLEELGLGYHRENIIREGQKPQPSAIKHAQLEPLVQDADWVMLFDADEFLAIRHPSGTLDGMISDAEALGANGIVITWRIFGSGGVIDWSRTPVTEQYLRAAPPLWNKGWGVKTLFKFDADYWKLGIHRPSIKNKHLETDFPDTVHWLNGSGQPMEDYFKFRGWRSIRRTLGYDWAQMNHYAVKSVDSYAVRKFRGNVNNKADKYNADYWSLQDRNEVDDRIVLRHRARRAEIMEALLEDPVLSELHEAANQRVEERLAEYKKTDAYQELRDGLIEAGKVPITQVEAKPPQARDPAKIAALMSRVEKKAVKESEENRPEEDVNGWRNAEGSYYLEPEIDRSADIAVSWVKNHDIELPADARIFSAEALNGVISGRFDRKHARNIRGYCGGFARILEIGAGICFGALRMRKEHPKAVLLCQDQRADLIKIAAEIAERNGLADSSKLKFSAADLVFPGDSQGRASGFEAYLNDFRPELLRISNPEILNPEYLRHANLKTVQRVVIPFESAEQHHSYLEGYTPFLKDAGLTHTPGRDENGSIQFDRQSQEDGPRFVAGFHPA